MPLTYSGNRAAYTCVTKPPNECPRGHTEGRRGRCLEGLPVPRRCCRACGVGARPRSVHTPPCRTSTLWRTHRRPWLRKPIRGACPASPIPELPRGLPPPRKVCTLGDHPHHLGSPAPGCPTTRDGTEPTAATGSRPRPTPEFRRPNSTIAGRGASLTAIDPIAIELVPVAWAECSN